MLIHSNSVANCQLRPTVSTNLSSFPQPLEGDRWVTVPRVTRYVLLLVLYRVLNNATFYRHLYRWNC